MTSSYPSLHARVNEKLAFSKIYTLESVFEKNAFPPDICERQVKPKEKNIGFQTKTDACGRGLHVIDMNKTKTF